MSAVTAVTSRVFAALLLSVALGGCITYPDSSGAAPRRNRDPLGAARNRYGHLPDMGLASRGARGVLDVPRGYYSGDLTLSGGGLHKRGAGIGECVIDGNVFINGDGWTLSGMTVRGDVVITGSDNDLSRCKVLGEIRVERGERNKRY